MFHIRTYIWPLRGLPYNKYKWWNIQTPWYWCENRKTPKQGRKKAEIILTGSTDVWERNQDSTFNKQWRKNWTSLCKIMDFIQLSYYVQKWTKPKPIKLLGNTRGSGVGWHRPVCKSQHLRGGGWKTKSSRPVWTT